MNDSMKQKIKLDKYAVYEKGRLYEVIVFPFIRYMYAYSRTGGDHDRDGCQIDAGRDAYTYLCYALAILAEDPGKLLYFPCKQTGYDGYFSHNYNVIFCRPDLQFRRSLWTRIKKKLDKKHWQGKYILQYDREKFYDYFENVLVRKYGYRDQNALASWAFKIQSGGYDNWKRFEGLIEEEINDTIFFVPERLRCYLWHYCIAKDLDDEDWEKEEEIHGMYTMKGYIYSDATIRRIEARVDKE